MSTKNLGLPYGLLQQPARYPERSEGPLYLPLPLLLPVLLLVIPEGNPLLPSLVILNRRAQNLRIHLCTKAPSVKNASSASPQRVDPKRINQSCRKARAGFSVTSIVPECPHKPARQSLDTHDKIEAEPNSSATIGLALFAGGDNLEKLNRARQRLAAPSQAFTVRPPSPKLAPATASFWRSQNLSRCTFAHLPRYIPTRKSFVHENINWYIPRHKSLICSACSIYQQTSRLL